MTPGILFTTTILATAFSAVALGSFLLWRARSAPGSKQLAVFVCIVGLYALGLIAPPRLGEFLLALAPLGAAVSVDFTTRLIGRGAISISIVYALGAGATLLQLVFGAGDYFETTDGLRGFRYAGLGLVGVVVAIAIAIYGNLQMISALQVATGKRRKQIAIVLASSIVGLSTVVSFAPPLFGVLVAPWSILALPIYPAMLVYGILRYELMVANAWARRAAAYALIVALAAFVAGLIAAAPLSRFAPSVGFMPLWLIVAGAMGLALALSEPIRRAADLLIYSDTEISARTIAGWRAELGRAETQEEMLDAARRHLRAAMRLPIQATFSEPESHVLALHCACAPERWAVRLSGFEDAPPGARRVAIVYADVLEQSLQDLERRKARAERERLAELGMLASTIAHDLRNPLNIINMAAVDAAPVARAEIIEQTRRMNRLVADLLDYAKPWRIEPVQIDLPAALSGVDANIEEGVRLRADPLRFAQAVDNLLANARAAGGRVVVFVERSEDGTLIHVCDDGPGIPDDIKDTLFQPFIARSSEGTGLGLAIVSKIMGAHRGSASLTRRDTFSTCITLRFPK